MKQILNDIGNFIGSLTFVNIIFFISVLALLIVMVIVIYLIKTRGQDEEDEMMDEVEEFTKTGKKQIDIDLFDLVADEKTPAEDILPPAEDEPAELLDLATLTKNISETDYEPIDRTVYETEQEEKAIISYEELLEHTGKMKINYAEETETDGISVKKVDLDNIATKEDTIEVHAEEKVAKVQLMNYDKEEAFLETLKNLKQMLS